MLQGFFPLLLPFLFKKDSPGEDDVVPLPIEFDHLELEPIADQGIKVPDGLEINLGSGQESDDSAKIDGEPPLDLGHDLALHHFPFAAGPTDISPDRHLVGLLFGKEQESFLAFLLLQEDLDPVSDLYINPLVPPEKLPDRNLPLGLVAHIHGHMVGGNVNDRPLQDLTLLQGLQALLIEFLKIFGLIPPRRFFPFGLLPQDRSKPLRLLFGGVG